MRGTLSQGCFAALPLLPQSAFSGARSCSHGKTGAWSAKRLALAAQLERHLLHGHRRPTRTRHATAGRGSADQTRGGQAQRPLVASLQLREMKIGVISDTHGLLRSEVASTLAGVERVLHLG